MANSIEMSTITTPERDTALLDACKDRVENLDEVQSLIESGANVNAVTPSGATPLMLASYRGHSEIVYFLLRNGADVDIKDKRNGMTSLMFAIDSINSRSDLYNVLTTINLLIQNNADINAQANEGITALMMVCEKCTPDDDRDDFIFRICDIFINNRNIDLSITDEYNKTAMDYANKNCNQNIKDLFSGHQHQDQPIDQPIDQPTNLQGGRRRSTRVKKYRRKSTRKSTRKYKRK